MDDARNGKESGGLAVLVIAGVLAALLLVCCGGGIYYVRHLQRMAILEAQRAALAARAGAERALADARRLEEEQLQAKQEAGLPGAEASPAANAKGAEQQAKDE